MFYTPHTLQRQRHTESLDDYGRTIGHSAEWQDVCPCRCDDNDTRFFQDENGKVYRPAYHIVAPKACPCVCGDIIRVLGKDGKERATGRVYNIRHCNVLDYAEVWI